MLNGFEPTPGGAGSSSIMNAPSYFLEQAERCRRLADRLLSLDDPVRLRLLDLARDYEAKAAAGAEAQEAAPKGTEG